MQVEVKPRINRLEQYPSVVQSAFFENIMYAHSQRVSPSFQELSISDIKTALKSIPGFPKARKVITEEGENAVLYLHHGESKLTMVTLQEAQTFLRKEFEKSLLS